MHEMRHPHTPHSCLYRLQVQPADVCFTCECWHDEEPLFVLLWVVFPGAAFVLSQMAAVLLFTDVCLLVSL